MDYPLTTRIEEDRYCMSAHEQIVTYFLQS